jgi:ABC-type multidrug transport system fused ATPase/permease subunit
MVYMPIGSISIDGIDHSHLTLFNLRRGFYVISQDQLQESESIRAQVDPEVAFTDQQISETLEACGLWKAVVNAGGLVADAADCKFSAGETQLLSVSRAILYGSSRKGGVVLLDEATSRYVWVYFVFNTLTSTSDVSGSAIILC